MMISQLQLLSFLLALLVGLLNGLERSYRAYKENEIKGAGIRTFTLVSITGYLFVYAFQARTISIIVLAGIFSFLFLSLPVIRSFENSGGLTTPIALLLIFLIGMIFGLERPLMGTLSGLILVSLTSSKKILHHFAKFLSKEDMMSAVRFLVVAVILLPIAYTLGPVHPLVGPGRVFDPLQALLMVIFVSTISFISYIIMKIVGAEKGLKISAFIGGLVSSAASTASVSEKFKNIDELGTDSIMGVLLANASMFIKDYIIIITVGGIALARSFLIPIALLLFLTLAFLVYHNRKKDQRDESLKGLKIELGTPFALRPAVKFAGVFSLVWVSSYILQNYVGGLGIYMVSFGGLVSTTSVSASISSLYMAGEIGAVTAVSTMLLAFGFGSLSKVLIVRAFSNELAKRTLIPMTVLSTASFILVALLN